MVDPADMFPSRLPPTSNDAGGNGGNGKAKQPAQPGNGKPKKNAKGQWVKGVSGNPSGKPKGAVSLITIIKRKLREVYDPETGETYGERMVQNIIEAAVEDNDPKALKAATELLDRVEGKATQRIHNVNEDKVDDFDLDALDDNEARQLEDLLAKAEAKEGTEQ